MELVVVGRTVVVGELVLDVVAGVVTGAEVDVVLDEVELVVVDVDVVLAGVLVDVVLDVVVLAAGRSTTVRRYAPSEP